MEMKMNYQMPFTMPSLSDKSKLDVNYEKVKEIKEAFDASELALKHLDKSIEILREARGWGAYDIVAGGGMSSYVKRDRMKAASKNMKATKEAVENFKSQIKDVEKFESLNLTESSLLLDVFFDNLFTDFVVQSKINEALDKCIDARRDIVPINKDLKSQLNPDLLAFYYLEKDKRELSPQEFNKKQKGLIDLAILKANKSLVILQKTQHSIDKTNEKIEKNKKIFGKNFSAESKWSKTKDLIKDSNFSIGHLYKSLEGIHDIHPTMSENLLKFKELTEKIVKSDNVIYKKDALQIYADASKGCADTISLVENILNILKNSSEKYHFEE